MRVLLIEDNPRLAVLIAQSLEQASYVAERVGSIAATEELLASITYDLALLDLGLPDGDGITWLRAFRTRDTVLPVLVISARGGLDDRIAGLDTGADDYLVKPFELNELLARTRAVLRRPGPGRGPIITSGNLQLHTADRTVHVGGQAVTVPRRELAMLVLLLGRSGKVVSREALEHSLYASETEITPNAIEALASRLRRRLGDAGADVSIHTIRGIGYLLQAP